MKKVKVIVVAIVLIFLMTLGYYLGDFLGFIGYNK